MRGEIIVLLAALAVCAVFSGCSSRGGEIWGEHAAGNYPSNQISESENEVAEMRLVSSEFKEGENIPVRFTCQGENINPQLSWEAVPEGTKSFALIMDDPDAPVGTWVHWLVKDIPADARQIPEDSVPGKEVLNSAGNARYGGRALLQALTGIISGCMR